MSTDWALVRAMMQSAIDACEKIEALGADERDRASVVEVDGQQISVFDIMTSAWVYPESLRYHIVRQRHEAAADQPYVPETARILVNVAQACAELIGAGKVAPADKECGEMMGWYSGHALPSLEKAIRARSKAE